MRRVRLLFAGVKLNLKNAHRRRGTWRKSKNYYRCIDKYRTYWMTGVIANIFVLACVLYRGGNAPPLRCFLVFRRTSEETPDNSAVR